MKSDFHSRWLPADHGGGGGGSSQSALLILFLLLHTMETGSILEFCDRYRFFSIYKDKEILSHFSFSTVQQYTFPTIRVCIFKCQREIKNAIRFPPGTDVLFFSLYICINICNFVFFLKKRTLHIDITPDDSKYFKAFLQMLWLLYISSLSSSSVKVLARNSPSPIFLPFKHTKAHTTYIQLNNC